MDLYALLMARQCLDDFRKKVDASLVEPLPPQEVPQRDYKRPTLRYKLAYALQTLANWIEPQLPMEVPNVNAAPTGSKPT